MSVSPQEVVDTFMAIDDRHLSAYNWGTEGPPGLNKSWEVGDCYINGIALTVDGDYWMGYLLEVCGRTDGSATVSYLAVNLYHGRGQDGTFIHDWTLYGQDCGTFFARPPEADQVVVGQWAVKAIYEMADKFFAMKGYKDGS